MPRIAGSTRGNGLAQRNAENEGNLTKIMSKGVVENRTRSGTALKRQAGENTVGILDAKNRRRAALGEITNAKSGNGAGGTEKETKTLKSQMKKGLSVIVNKTTAKTNTTNYGKSLVSATNVSTKRTSNAKDKINSNNLLISTIRNQSLKEFDESLKSSKNVASKKCTRQKEAAETSTSSLEEDIEMLSFDSRTESRSLPSSQETDDLAKQLEDKANDLYTTVSENDIESPFSSSNCTQSTTELSESIEDQKQIHPSSRYVAPARPIPPAGITDFDLENWRDPSQCSEYAQDIFQYYKDREEQFCCPDYLHSLPSGKRRGSIGQADITEGMRSILVDWLVEVQESFELNHETLYTAVKLMDLYLSKVFVTKEELQLIGATACLIACKIDERIPPNLDDFVYVCDDAYSRQEIMAKERDMIETVDYDVGYPLSYRFLRRFGRVCQVTMPVLTFARYILETSLMEYKFNVQLSESLLAAATLALALKVQNIDDSQWMAPLMYYSGHDLPNIRPVFLALHQMLFQEPKDATKTIRQKYSHRVFHEVALIKIPEVLDL